MHYVSLLMNSKLFNSPFFKSDLELLKSVKDINILIIIRIMFMIYLNLKFTTFLRINLGDLEILLGDNNN